MTEAGIGGNAVRLHGAEVPSAPEFRTADSRTEKTALAVKMRAVFSDAQGEGCGPIPRARVSRSPSDRRCPGRVGHPRFGSLPVARSRYRRFRRPVDNYYALVCCGYADPSPRRRASRRPRTLPSGDRSRRGGRRRRPRRSGAHDSRTRRLARQHQGLRRHLADDARRRRGRRDTPRVLTPERERETSQCLCSAST